MSDYILKNGVLYHHGIKGQKWGTRNYQYEDGSLTPEGRIHYGYGEARAKYKATVKKLKAERKEKDRKVQDNYFKKMEDIEKGYKRGQNLSEKDQKRELELDNKSRAAWDKNKKEYKEAIAKAKQEYKNSEEYKQAKDRAKKIAIAGAAIAGTALAAYGIYKYSQLKKEKALSIEEANGKRLAKDMMRSYESAKESINSGSISGRNEHYKWTTGKNGTYSIRALTDSEKYADNVRAATEYNKRMEETIKRGLVPNATYTKAVPYDPRKLIVKKK